MPLPIVWCWEHTTRYSADGRSTRDSRRKPVAAGRAGGRNQLTAPDEIDSLDDPGQRRVDASCKVQDSPTEPVEFPRGGEDLAGPSQDEGEQDGQDKKERDRDEGR